MKLIDILKDVDFNVVCGNINTDFNKIEYDSRNVEDGDVFVCISGFKTDGHTYAKMAYEKGASVIICEKDIEKFNDTITIIKVSNTRKVLGEISANFYNNPSKELNLIGVTGTNGKTTTTFLIKSVLEKIKHKVGIIGTIENLIGDKALHTERTTPESLELQKLFRQMKSENVDDVVMEVSSHSLDLYRVDSCNFNIGIFTNLTQDHLDYHKTMENYKIAKSRLFELCEKSVINIDDKAGEFMVSKSAGKPVITFAIDRDADLKAEDIHISSDGVKFKLDYKDKQYSVELNIPGKFSIYNALGAIGTCILMDIPMEVILDGLKDNKGVKGRFQTIKSEKGFNAIVDYAHTPDGLENILETAKEFVKGKIITVFGCGGDRDRTKRPIMGEIAGNLSDFCIITSDNPRTEDPALILDDVEEGTKRTACKYVKIVDRKEAIYKAVEMAEKDDIIVIAGKGHENYQIFKDKTIHFDDAEIIRQAFEGDKNK